MRNVIEWNADWRFSKENKLLPLSLPLDWHTVDLPHTWNAKDGQNGFSDYFRGACWYTKVLPCPAQKGTEKVYLEILAAASAATVFVNGTEICTHEGGYAAFRADITAALKDGDNLIAICVDNSEKSNIYPQMADFTFYGGLYRGVNIIVANSTHFDLDYYGASGLSVTSKVISGGAMLTLDTFVTNAAEGDTVEFSVVDPTQGIVAEAVRPAGEKTQAVLGLPGAHLWQGVDDSFLYHCTARLVRKNEVVDEIATQFGVREFYVDPEKGFFLNGKSMPLRGVSRHQDRLGIGNALTAEEHWDDALLIHELGANTVRLAHYQHHQEFYDACDALGLVVWAEIPFISSMSADVAAHENCRNQMKELICQNYNHASICFWGIANEITIGGELPGLKENLQDLNLLVHTLDATRLTTIAHVSMVPMDSWMNEITDVLSYNHYFGWYGGEMTDNETWLDAFHAAHPDRALGLSEYGAEGILTYHSDAPKCRDYSEDYQALYHEHMAAVIAKRPYLWATYVWNMFDFGCDARSEGGVEGRNNKGLVTIDRKIKKDAFFVYKAYWSENPFVHVAGRRYAQRTGDTTTVKVYSNQPSVALYVNGSKCSVLGGDRKVFVFENVPMSEGFTSIVAKAGELTDSICLEKVAVLPASYTFIDPDDNGTDSGATNWFETADLTAAPAEMTFDADYYSVKDPMNDILKSEEAGAVILNAISSMMGMNLKKTMLKMMGSKSIEEMGGMMAGKAPAGAMEFINSELQKVKKV